MFKGSIVAIVTPMQNDKIDYEAFANLIEFQIQNKTAGIVVCGCTGEPATLTMEEHKAIVKYAIDVVNGRCFLIAGTGSNNTKEAIELTEEAEQAGADGALVITPYYNKPMPQGLYLHYKKIAESVALPVIIYNVPSRTGVSILPETVYELSKIENIVGIKEASGSLDQVSNIIRLCRQDFHILSGDDSLTLPIMAVGGQGVISVAANIVPLQVSEMVASALSGDWENARRLHIELLPIFKGLFIETNPIPVKAALGLMGKISPEWRLPLTPPSDRSLAKLKEILIQGKVL